MGNSTNNHKLEKQILNKVNLTTKYQFKNLADLNDNKQSILISLLEGDIKIELNNHEITYLIKNSDLKQTNDLDYDSLMIVIFYDSGSLKLNTQHLDYLIKNSDLRYINRDGQSSLMAALENNKYRALNLTKGQWDYLIKSSDLKHTNKNARNSLGVAIHCNENQRLNLKSEQWDYLIKNSDLKQVDIWGWSNLAQALLARGNECLKLSEDQWKYLVENSNLLQICQPRDSILGLVIENKPDLIEIVFQKAINHPDFNLDNYKKDTYYKEICELVETYKVKQNIDSDINKTTTNNHLKI